MHRRSGTSWTRPAEATAIARQLQAWISSEAGRNLSYGVISFYKAQAELIRNHLKTITDDDKRLRVGTVDAFQGMEFDVVFLSVVRTGPQGRRVPDDDREKQARKLFGHLCLYNRLNVSMSRQIKLLVVAGDSALLRNDLASEHIPGLVDFLALCEREGRIMQCR
jgi:superfamily I DNA and/or RNA helicase